MATRNPQTAAKRAREQAVKERRERKLAKKKARADAVRDGSATPEAGEEPEVTQG
ncbi:MAG TPA: hypothetical protein VGJ77_08595 [Gaiellaceae bacterium]|jgi:hypothetical protein